MTHPPRATLFWRLQIVGWVLCAIATFPLKVSAFPTVAAAVVITFTREPFGFLLTCGMRLIYRRLPQGRPFLLLVLLILSIVAGGIDGALGRFVLAEMGHPEEHLVTLGVVMLRSSLYVAWSLLYFGIKAVRETQERELNLAHAETSLREAELQLLRAQINPHFLFNALNTIAATLEPDQMRPRRVVDGLAAYLRYSLQYRHEATVPLGVEYDAALHYLAVEQERFRDELLADCTIEDAARHVLVPGVLIQPLIENALKYSRQTSEPPYRVRLHVGVIEAGIIAIEVANTGTWVEPSTAAGPHGSGLENLGRRLALVYPSRHKLETASSDGWVTVRVQIEHAGSQTAPAQSEAAPSVLSGG